MLFNDISNYTNVNDYLPIINGCLNTDLLIIFFVYHSFLNSKTLTKWYKKFQLSAVLADVSIMTICIIITRFLYGFIFKSWNIIYFIVLALLVQVTHDILFYICISNIPYGYNAMLDFFKSYAKESGFRAIIGNNLAIISSIILSSIFTGYNLNTNIINLIITLYFVPYMINYI